VGELGDHLNCLAFSPDGYTLASGSWRETTAGYLNEIRLWDVRSRTIVRRITQHKRVINALAFSPNGKLLASASRDSTVRLWATASGKELRQFQCGLMESVAFSPDGRTLIAVERVRGGERIWTWDTESGKEQRDLAAALNSWPKFDGDLSASAPDYIWYTQTGFSPDGKLLAVTRRLETIVQVFDAASGKQRFLLRGHDRPVICFAFSPDSRTMATAAWDYTIRLWDLATGKELLRLSGHRGKVNGLAFLPNGNSLLSGSDDTTVLVWDVERITKRKRPRPSHER
jgi:WD40 repeat protein